MKENKSKIMFLLNNATLSSVCDKDSSNNNNNDNNNNNTYKHNSIVINGNDTIFSFFEKTKNNFHLDNKNILKCYNKNKNNYNIYLSSNNYVNYYNNSIIFDSFSIICFILSPLLFLLYFYKLNN